MGQYGDRQILSIRFFKLGWLKPKFNFIENNHSWPGNARVNFLHTKFDCAIMVFIRISPAQTSGRNNRRKAHEFKSARRWGLRPRAPRFSERMPTPDYPCTSTLFKSSNRRAMFTCITAFPIPINSNFLVYHNNDMEPDSLKVRAVLTHK